MYSPGTNRETTRCTRQGTAASSTIQNRDPLKYGQTCKHPSNTRRANYAYCPTASRTIIRHGRIQQTTRYPPVSMQGNRARIATKNYPNKENDLYPTDSHRLTKAKPQYRNHTTHNSDQHSITYKRQQIHCRRRSFYPTLE